MDHKMLKWMLFMLSCWVVFVAGSIYGSFLWDMSCEIPNYQYDTVVRWRNSEKLYVKYFADEAARDGKVTKREYEQLKKLDEMESLMKARSEALK